MATIAAIQFSLGVHNPKIHIVTWHLEAVKLLKEITHKQITNKAGP